MQSVGVFYGGAARWLATQPCTHCGPEFTSSEIAETADHPAMLALEVWYDDTKPNMLTWECRYSQHHAIYKHVYGLHSLIVDGVKDAAPVNVAPSCVA